MKYAAEILGLMPAYPKRKWKMAELVREVLRGQPTCIKRRNAARQSVLRVLNALEESGQISKEQVGPNMALYKWSEVRHEAFQNCDRRCDNSARALAS